MLVLNDYSTIQIPQIPGYKRPGPSVVPVFLEGRGWDDVEQTYTYKVTFPYRGEGPAMLADYCFFEMPEGTKFFGIVIALCIEKGQATATIEDLTYELQIPISSAA